jgi:DNA-binding NarL/FixJ family response regulator
VRLPGSSVELKKSGGSEDKPIGSMCSNSQYHILLADDHTLVRRWIKRILEESPELTVIGEVANGQDLLHFLETYTPDLIILDISMPQLGGLEALPRIKEKGPHIKVLMLTMHRNKEYLDYALAAGAEGYLLKEEVDRELFSAITTIRQGGTYISRLLLKDHQ